MGILLNTLASVAVETPFGYATIVAPFTYNLQLYFTAWATKYVNEWANVEDTPNRQYIIEQVVEIGDGVRYDYTKKNSFADCTSDEVSYFFDIGLQQLNLHVGHNRRCSTFVFQISSIDGFVRQYLYYDANNIEYKPLLSSTPIVSFDVDPLVYSKIAFPSQSFRYKNGPDHKSGAGYFDGFADAPIPGGTTNLIWIDDEGTEHDVYSGTIDTDSLNENEYRIKTKDARSFLQAAVPTRIFNSTDFPDAGQETWGNVVTDGYGFVLGIPAYKIDYDAVGGIYTFKCAEVVTLAITVYVKTENTWNQILPMPSVSADGEFELDEADCTDGSGNLKSVKVDCTLRNLTHPMDIITDGNERFIDYVYDSSNYDTAEVTSEKAILGADPIGIAFTKQQSWYKWIEAIQGSSTKGFILYVQGEGKFSFRVDDDTRAGTFSIVNMDAVNVPTGERDFKEYASRVRVYYAKDYSTGRRSWESNDEYVNVTIGTYRYIKDVSYESYLVTPSAAQTKADNIADAYHEVRPVFNVEVKEPWAFDIKPYSIGTFVSKRVNGRDVWGTMTSKVIGYRMNFDKGSVLLKLQKIGA